MLSSSHTKLAGLSVLDRDVAAVSPFLMTEVFFFVVVVLFCILFQSFFHCFCQNCFDMFKKDYMTEDEQRCN